MTRRNSIDLALNAGPIVVGELVDLVADDLDAPQLRLLGDQDLEEVGVAAGESALDPIVGRYSGGCLDRIVGLGFDTGLDGSLP